MNKGTKDRANLLIALPKVLEGARLPLCNILHRVNNKFRTVFTKELCLLARLEAVLCPKAALKRQLELTLTLKVRIPLRVPLSVLRQTVQEEPKLWFLRNTACKEALEFPGVITTILTLVGGIIFA